MSTATLVQNIKASRNSRVVQILSKRGGSATPPLDTLTVCGGCGRCVCENEIIAPLKGDLSQGRCYSCVSDPRAHAQIMSPSGMNLFPDVGGSVDLVERIRAYTGKSLAQVRTLPMVKATSAPRDAGDIEVFDRELKRIKKTNWWLLCVPILILMLLSAIQFTVTTQVAFMSSDEFAELYHKADPLWDMAKDMWKGAHMK